MNPFSDRPYDLKDSGQRQTFDTGSRRDTREGKGRYDLMPTLPMQRMALLYEAGAKKYGDRNWEKGQPLSRYLDSAMRHLVSWMAGDRSEEHLIQCAWNCWAYVQTEAWIKEGRLPAHLNDVDQLPPLMRLDSAAKPCSLGHYGCTYEHDMSRLREAAGLGDHGLRGGDGAFHALDELVDEHDAGLHAPRPGTPDHPPHSRREPR